MTQNDVFNETPQRFNDAIVAYKERRDNIHRFISECFTEGVHYGSATGKEGGKPSLLKPGAEDLLNFCNLVADPKTETFIGDGEQAPELRVVVRCEIHERDLSGPIVAVGVGAANSWETKHRYRSAKMQCPLCHQDAIIKSKAEYGGGWYCFPKSQGCGAKFPADDDRFGESNKAENPDPFDAENNLTKMAAKRAQLDGVLRATGTSSVFTQDQESTPTPTAKAIPAIPSYTPPTSSTAQYFKDTPAPPGAVQDAEIISPAPDSDGPVLSGDPRVDLVAVAGYLATTIGGTVQDHIFNASKFTKDGKEFGFKMPNDRTSDKWISSTLGRLKKKLAETKVAAPAEEVPF